MIWTNPNGQTFGQTSASTHKRTHLHQSAHCKRARQKKKKKNTTQNNNIKSYKLQKVQKARE